MRRPSRTQKSPISQQAHLTTNSSTGTYRPDASISAHDEVILEEVNGTDKEKQRKLADEAKVAHPKRTAPTSVLKSNTARISRVVFRHERVRLRVRLGGARVGHRKQCMHRHSDTPHLDSPPPNVGGNERRWVTHAEIFVRAIPPEDQDWITMSATMIPPGAKRQLCICHPTSGSACSSAALPSPNATTLSRAYAISGQAVKVSQKTVGSVESLIARAVGNDKDKAVSTSPSTRDNKPPLPPRRKDAAATSSPPRGKSPDHKSNQSTPSSASSSWDARQGLSRREPRPRHSRRLDIVLFCEPSTGSGTTNKPSAVLSDDKAIIR